jgi:hypothetical protein
MFDWLFAGRLLVDRHRHPVLNPARHLVRRFNPVSWQCCGLRGRANMLILRRPFPSQPPIAHLSGQKCSLKADRDYDSLRLSRRAPSFRLKDDGDSLQRWRQEAASCFEHEEHHARQEQHRCND